jgi:hypothetical protein
MSSLILVVDEESDVEMLFRQQFQTRSSCRPFRYGFCPLGRQSTSTHQ